MTENVTGRKAHLSKNDYKFMMWNLIKDRDKNKCGICGEELDPNDCTIEEHHILPVSLGGKDEFSNLQLVHYLCHKQRHIEIAAKIAEKLERKRLKKGIKREASGKTLKKGMVTIRQQYYEGIGNEIRRLLGQTNNKTEIARTLNISRPTLYDLMHKLQIA